MKAKAPYHENRKSRTPYGVLCHPDRPRYGHGLCRSCYRKRRYHNDPEYRKKIDASAKKTRLKNREKILAHRQKYREERKNDPAYLEDNRIRGREYYQKHKDDPEFKEKRRARARIYNPLYRVRKGDELNRKTQEWRKAHPELVFDSQLRTEYGITTEQYRQMIFDQNGKCAICGKDTVKLKIDHNHMTQEVRGLLCTPCNIRLGIYEKTEWVKKALAYLADPPMNKIIAMREEKQIQ